MFYHVFTSGCLTCPNCVVQTGYQNLCCYYSRVSSSEFSTNTWKKVLSSKFHIRVLHELGCLELADASPSCDVLDHLFGGKRRSIRLWNKWSIRRAFLQCAVASKIRMKILKAFKSLAGEYGCFKSQKQQKSDVKLLIRFLYRIYNNFSKFANPSWVILELFCQLQVVSWKDFLMQRSTHRPWIAGFVVFIDYFDSVGNEKVSFLAILKHKGNTKRIFWILISTLSIVLAVKFNWDFIHHSLHS
jgi:hypothetical protein